MGTQFTFFPQTQSIFDRFSKFNFLVNVCLNWHFWTLPPALADQEPDSHLLILVTISCNFLNCNSNTSSCLQEITGTVEGSQKWVRTLHFCLNLAIFLTDFQNTFFFWKLMKIAIFPVYPLPPPLDWWYNGIPPTSTNLPKNGPSAHKVMRWIWIRPWRQDCEKWGNKQILYAYYLNVYL